MTTGSISFEISEQKPVSKSVLTDSPLVLKVARNRSVVVFANCEFQKEMDTGFILGAMVRQWFFFCVVVTSPRNRKTLKKPKNIGEIIMANKERSVKYSPTDYLKTKEDMVEYLNAAIEDGNERVLLMALRNVVDALGGMTRLAKGTGLTRESLYRTLSENGNPRLSSLVAMLHYMDLELAVRPRSGSRR